MKKTKYTFLFFIFNCFLLTQAQEQGCLAKFQLSKMQSSSIDDIRTFLNNENWSLQDVKSDQSYEYFNYSISYNVVSWAKSDYNGSRSLYLFTSPNKPNIVIYKTNQSCFNYVLNSIPSSKVTTKVEDDKLVTTFTENGVSIEFREYKNDYTDRQYSILVYNGVSLMKEIKIQRDKEEAIKKAELERIKKYNDIVAVGDKLFENGQYANAKIKYAEAKEIDFNDLIETKIESCDKAICGQYIQTGDSSFTAGNYDLALQVYNLAKQCYKYTISSLQEKIKLTEKKIIDDKVAIIKRRADKYFSEKKYDLASQEYNSILKLDFANSDAIIKIKEIERIIELLSNRSKFIYSYRETNNGDYLRLLSEIEKDINTNINDSRQGYVDVSYNICFDTTGSNLSKITKMNSSIKDYNSKFTDLVNNVRIEPYKESDFYLSSKDNIALNARWNIQKSVIRLNSKYSLNQSNLDESFKTIQEYLSNSNTKYGKYIFEIKHKDINGSIFSDIRLVKFKTVGPEATLISMIMPGMGTLKVTYGKKGWGTFTCFLLSSGVALGSKLYSDAQYKKYRTATNQEDMNKYYKSANIFHKIALVSAGISASIYLYDVIWVFSKGIKNVKNSSNLRNQLKKSPIILQDQPIYIPR